MVRDLARSLGKQVRLEIVGQATQVDRDMLERLDAPLGHLLRNAIDHGIESADERRAAGKPAEGVMRLEARHSAGMLQIIVSDDGGGIDLDKLRAAIVERKLTTPRDRGKLSEAELLEFLFLPGFHDEGDASPKFPGAASASTSCRTWSNRCAAPCALRPRRARARAFSLQLPLTLSVVRTLLVEIGGEPYAFPLAHIVRTLKLPKEQIEVLEGRQHFSFDGRRVGLVTAHQVLDGGEAESPGDELPVVVVGDQTMHLRSASSTGFSGSVNWSCSRSTRGSARSRTLAPAR